MDHVSFSAVIPAAGIGQRVGADIPKQYLPILGKTIIEHSLTPFLAHPDIHRVIVSIAPNDQWFRALTIAQHPKLTLVEGGKERVDSVLSALQVLPSEEYILVHDAARPCIQTTDINKLIQHAKAQPSGAILASRVRDTMKRSNPHQRISETVERKDLWHALTPQLFKNKQLINAITSVTAQHLITDEASAIEMHGGDVMIIEGRSDNLKVTTAEDLLLAEFYLSNVITKDKK